MKQTVGRLLVVITNVLRVSFCQYAMLKMNSDWVPEMPNHNQVSDWSLINYAFFCDASYKN